MTNLVKKHMIGLFALVLTVATMSFKMVEKSQSNEDIYWFVVSGNTVTETTLTYSCEGEEEIVCAVAFSTDQKPSEVTTVTQAQNHANYRGIQYRADD